MSKKNKIPTDKKGFRVLTDQDDFYRLFGEEKRTGQEDFARLLAEYQEDRRHQALLEEKKQAATKTRPLTMKERIKSYPAPQVELDLHGDRGTEAEKRTEVFIRDAREKRIRTLRLIVGKGLHSQGKAVLPDIVEKKIIQLRKEKCILHFEWEKKDKLKSGALIVYLWPPL